MTGVVSTLATIGLQVARPWPLKWMLDVLAAPETAAVLPAFPAWVPPTTGARIGALALLFVALSAGAAVLTMQQQLGLYRLGARVVQRFRAAMFDHLLRQPLTFHAIHTPGELLTRVVSDTARLRRGLTVALTRVGQTAVLWVATVLALLVVDARLAGILLVGSVLAVLTMQRRGRRIVMAAQRQRQREGRLASLVDGELRAVRELQVFGTNASRVLARFVRRSDRGMRQELKVQRLTQGVALRVDLLLAVSIAAALLLGAWSVLDGGRTHGDLVLFLSYALSLRGPAVDFAWSSSRLGRTLACAARLERIMNAKATPSGEGTAAPVEPLRHALRFEGVALRSHKKLRHGRKWLVDDLSFAIPAGRRVAVFGENGAGKSTVLSLLLRLVEPTRGAVYWDDVSLGTLDVGALRADCSVVFQQSVLPGLSVRDNIALGNPTASEADILAAASAAGVDAVVASLPAGYDTVIRRGGDLLSGGERQRIAIARALLRNGSLWLLDEPLTGLDDAAADAITATLFSRTAGRTTLWITHDPAFARTCDWILELDHGALRYCGPAAAWRTDLPPAPVAAPLTLLRT